MDITCNKHTVFHHNHSLWVHDHFHTFTHLFLHFWAFLKQNWARFGLLPSAQTRHFFWNRFCFWAIWNFRQNPTNLDSGAPQKSEVCIQQGFLYKREKKTGAFFQDWKSHTFPSGIWLPKNIFVWPNFYQELSNGNFFEGPENPTNATSLFSGHFFEALIRQKRWDNGGESLKKVATFLGGKGWHSRGWYPSIPTIWVGSTTLWRRI